MFEFLFIAPYIIAILIMSVVIHEVSHGFVADLLGDPTARLQGRLTLNPLKHLDLFGSFLVPLVMYISTGFMFGWAKPVPYNPYNLKHSRLAEAYVAGAGPLSNLIIASLFGLALRFGVNTLSSPVVEALSLIVLINIVLAVFNLVPIPPLDGSKILFTLLPARFQNIRFFLERYGLILVLLFILVLWQLLNPIVFFIFSALTGL
jgi:Zn-dependent protease